MESAKAKWFGDMGLKKLNRYLLIVALAGFIVLITGGWMMLAFGPITGGYPGPGVGLPVEPYYQYGIVLFFAGIAILLSNLAAGTVALIHNKPSRNKQQTIT